MTNGALVRFSSDLNPANQPVSALVPIRFRDIALFLLGNGFIGCVIALLTGLPAYSFTHSKFVAECIGGISLYATFIVGYCWTSQEWDWTGLRTRFSPVGRKPLILSALTAIATIAFINRGHRI